MIFCGQSCVDSTEKDKEEESDFEKEIFLRKPINLAALVFGYTGFHGMEFFSPRMFSPSMYRPVARVRHKLTGHRPEVPNARYDELMMFSMMVRDEGCLTPASDGREIAGVRQFRGEDCLLGNGN